MNDLIVIPWIISLVAMYGVGRYRWRIGVFQGYGYARGLDGYQTGPAADLIREVTQDGASGK